MLINHHWYNQNELRSYPIDDSATCTADDGSFLPSNIIADLTLKFPESLGRYPFVSSVTVTPLLVSITFQVASSLDGDPGFSPLAVVTVTQPVTEGQHIAVEAMYPGVGGWIVFGSGVQSSYGGRFSTPRQSFLAPRAARPYRDFPIQSISKLSNFTPLTGIVLLKGLAPIEIAGESRDIDGVERDVIVFRLVQPAGQENVFEQFAGPCGVRPESQNCGDPAPIEFIGNVGPACDGHIVIEITGCGELARLVDTCGVVIDCDQSLADACAASRLPDETGRLPNEYTDLCDFVESESSSSSPSPSESMSSSSSGSSISLSCDLPHSDVFSDSEAEDFEVVQGEFVVTITEDDVFYSTEGPLGAASRNIALWQCDVLTTERIVTARMLMLAGPSGARHNGGVVLNYRPHNTIPTRVEYYLAEIDYEALVFRLMRFNGTSFATLTSASISNLKIGDKYEIQVEITNGPSVGQVSITSILTGVTEPSISATLGPVVTNTYLPDDGLFGLHANRAHARFDSFAVEVL